MGAEVVQVSDAAILAAKKYLQGSGPWKLDEIGIGADDYLVRCFAEAMDEERAAIVDYLQEQGVQAKEHGFGESAVLIFAAAKDIKRGDHRKETP